MKYRIAILFLLGVTACSSVLEPNTDEMRSDLLWSQKNYTDALALIEPLAEQGYPWAQLRLGVAYEYGQGKEASPSQAMNWYKKVAVQMKDDAWADGLILLSAGRDGYFNQNSDAMVAQYLIGRLYSTGGKGLSKDPAEAWLWIHFVNNYSKGTDLLYCCENSSLGAQRIPHGRISELLEKIEAQMAPETLEKIKSKSVSWRPH